MLVSINPVFIKISHVKIINLFLYKSKKQCECVNENKAPAENYQQLIPLSPSLTRLFRYAG